MIYGILKFYGIPGYRQGLRGHSVSTSGSSKYIDVELAVVRGERDPLTYLAMHAVGIHGHDYCSLVRQGRERAASDGGLNSFWVDDGVRWIDLPRVVYIRLYYKTRAHSSYRCRQLCQDRGGHGSVVHIDSNFPPGIYRASELRVPHGTA